MKYMNAGMILLFVVAGALQYSDSDPIIWITVYGAAALLCVAFAVGRFPTIVGSVFAAGSLVVSLVFVWKLLATDALDKSELFNEAAGLFIVFLWISTLAWTQQRDQSAIT
jgi:hypothetical protein